MLESANANWSVVVQLVAVRESESRFVVKPRLAPSRFTLQSCQFDTLQALQQHLTKYEGSKAKANRSNKRNNSKIKHKIKMVGRWSPKQVRDLDEKRKQYDLERGAPDDFLPGSGYESNVVSPTRKKVVRKWKPSTPVESQKVDSWIGGSPMGQKPKRSYKIIREIPPPSL